MAYWIFKCNPKRYRLTDRLADGNNATSWRVLQHGNEMRPGDTVFLWATGENRGIRAAMRIDETPEERAELEHEKEYCDDIDTEVRVRVLATLTHRNVDLRAARLRTVPGLENLSALHGYRGVTNYRVAPAEGAILTGLIEECCTPLSGQVASLRQS